MEDKEILNIIKKYMRINENEFITHQITMHLFEFLNEPDYKIIKEWLKNE